MNIARIRSLVVKELLAVLRDKKSRLALFMPPILQLGIFAFAATLEVKNVSLAVLDMDGGKAAVELTQPAAHGRQVASDVVNKRNVSFLFLRRILNRWNSFLNFNFIQPTT